LADSDLDQFERLPKATHTYN